MPARRARPASRPSFRRLLRAHLDRAARMPEEIAAALGLPDAAALARYLEPGERMPVEMLFPLAEALEVEQADLLAVWLLDYEPRIARALDSSLILPLTWGELSWILELRRQVPRGVPLWSLEIDDLMGDAIAYCQRGEPRTGEGEGAP